MTSLLAMSSECVVSCLFIEFNLIQRIPWLLRQHRKSGDIKDKWRLGTTQGCWYVDRLVNLVHLQDLSCHTTVQQQEWQSLFNFNESVQFFCFFCWSLLAAFYCHRVAAVHLTTTRLIVCPEFVCPEFGSLVSKVPKNIFNFCCSNFSEK